MEHLDFSAGKSSRREIHRPRPAPLKVHIESHKIKKPPVVPSQPQQSRQPVITYVVSPKVIHTSPSDFMTLVQRLTGLSSSAKYPGERTISLKSPKAQVSRHDSAANGVWGHIEANGWGQRIPEEKKSQVGTKMSTELPARTSFFPGILSSAQTATPNFFPPPSDQNPMSFYQDLSPSLRGNKNFMEGNFLANHNSYFLSPHVITTPTPSLDLFNNSFTFKREN